MVTLEYFNKFVYHHRIRISAETFLIEANHRAGLEGKKAWVHVVGLGLGVWKLLSKQPVSASGDIIMLLLRLYSCSNGMWKSLETA